MNEDDKKWQFFSRGLEAALKDVLNIAETFETTQKNSKHHKN